MPTTDNQTPGFSKASELVPWCPLCECFSVPNDDSECGECGARIIYRRPDR